MGQRRFDTPAPSEIEQLSRYVRSHVAVRRTARGGRWGAEHLIAALRCVYNHAVADGLIAEAENPTCRVAKPRRLPSTRRAVPDTRLAETNRVAASPAGTAGPTACDTPTATAASSLVALWRSRARTTARHPDEATAFPATSSATCPSTPSSTPLADPSTPPLSRCCDDQLNPPKYAKGR